MTTDAVDMNASIVPKSDQLNAEDLLSGPRTVTVTAVRRGSIEQPVDIVLAEYGDGRPFKPSKTVRRILVAVWGVDASGYVGRRMTIYRDPAVRFGGQDVGGIRISHMSGIEKPVTIALTVTRGKRAPYTVQPLAGQSPSAPSAPLEQEVTDAVSHFRDTYQVNVGQLEAWVGCPLDGWSASDLGKLRALSGELKRGEKRPVDEFPRGETS